MCSFKRAFKKINEIFSEIKLNGRNLAAVRKFKYLGHILMENIFNDCDIETAKSDLREQKRR